jgi:hypothetical protein
MSKGKIQAGPDPCLSPKIEVERFKNEDEWVKVTKKAVESIVHRWSLYKSLCEQGWSLSVRKWPSLTTPAIGRKDVITRIRCFSGHWI